MAKHFLSNHVMGEPGAFRPNAFYNADGDCFELYIADEGVVADRIDEVITIYRSVVDNRPVGCQVKGLGALVRMLDADKIEIFVEEDGGTVRRVKVNLILAAALHRSFKHDPRAPRRFDRYTDLFDVMSSKDVRETELAIA